MCWWDLHNCKMTFRIRVRCAKWSQEGITDQKFPVSNGISSVTLLLWSVCARMDWLLLLPFQGEPTVIHTVLLAPTQIATRYMGTCSAWDVAQWRLYVTLYLYLLSKGHQIYVYTWCVCLYKWEAVVYVWGQPTSYWYRYAEAHFNTATSFNFWHI